MTKRSILLKNPWAIILASVSMLTCPGLAFAASCADLGASPTILGEAGGGTVTRLDVTMATGDMLTLSKTEDDKSRIGKDGIELTQEGGTLYRDTPSPTYGHTATATGTYALSTFGKSGNISVRVSCAQSREGDDGTDTSPSSGLTAVRTVAANAAIKNIQSHLVAVSPAMGMSALADADDGGGVVLAASRGRIRVPGYRRPPRPKTSGRANLSVWGRASRTDISNSLSENRYGGDIHTYSMGVDYRMSGTLLAGLAASHSETNIAIADGGGTYREESRSLSPYLLWRPTDGFYLSGIAGHSLGHADTSRDGGKVIGNAGTKGWFVAGTAAILFRPIDNIPVNVEGGLSVLEAQSITEAHTESDGIFVAESGIHTRQVRPGIGVSGHFSAGGVEILPFARAMMTRDLRDEINSDRTFTNISGGVRLGSESGGFGGSLEMERRMGHKDYVEKSGSLLLSYGIPVAGVRGFAVPYVRSGMDSIGMSQELGARFDSEGGDFSVSAGLTRSGQDFGGSRQHHEVRANLFLKF